MSLNTPGRRPFRTLAGTGYVVTVNRRIVDATYLRAVVPSMRRLYSVAPGVDRVAQNGPPNSAPDHMWSSVGKTGMDVCLWLPGNDVCPGQADLDHAA